MFGYAHFDRLSDRSDQSDKKLEDSDELNSANKRFEVGEPAGLVSVVEPTKFVIKKLGEVAKIKNGKDYKTLENGNIPVYGSGGIMTYVNKSVYDKPTVLIPRK